MAQPHPLENLYQEELYKIHPKVMVVVPRPWKDLSPDEISLLRKIFNAVKLSLDAVQIVNAKQFSVDDFKTFQPLCIIAFGSTLKDSSRMYENVLVGGIPVVMAHELRALDDATKKSLWTILRQVFHS
ncbi:hypothetical protein [Chryseolinea sp. H1M3-3]|uniref:hypothetical protein n=1 Tax=Chryseolinea sp. H1M3-3 TaxID=3034144 RepID=UPI0023EBC265|nr:hypothetical protein [Chryseolinea sp. H1M3-3]